MINVFQPLVAERELASVGSVFASGWLGTGERVKQLEQTFGGYVGRPQTQMVAVSSATEGLFHAVSALGLGPGDDVVLPSVSFVGAAHAVRSTGARVSLCDVDPVTLNPSVDQVERAIGPTTAAILVLHYGGDPGDVVAISELAAERSLVLIEDAACGLGSFVDGHACGTFGDIGIWSFDSMKVMTTGDGGMVWSRESEIVERLRRSTKLGVGPSGFVNRSEGSRWWEIDPRALGRRGAMNDVCAAIGLAQFERLPDFLRRRADVAGVYDAHLRDASWVNALGTYSRGAAHTFAWIQVPPLARDRLAAHLLDRGIYTTFKYWPLHRMRMYRSEGDFPGADHAAATTLLLPLHQALSDVDVDRVLDAIATFRP